MKKIIPFIALLSPAALANTYIGIEAGTADVKSEESITSKDGAIDITPEGSDTVIGGFIGYKFENNWAVEFSYSQFSSEDSITNKELNQGIVVEQELDAEFDANQFALKPVYFYPLSENLTLKASLGITYTQYEFSSSYEIEYDSVLDVMDIDIPVAKSSNDDDAFGGIVSVGLEYNVWDNLNLGANVKYQQDSIASNTQFNISASYYF
ncbi:AcfA family outer membrane beta-barrel protein [Thalassotalea crassostreae]|uniref:AcfA family outer membrane beta-barrel protein n=1 Tax=Thalassotalea crassostreae TaxID=1763536 RepID=UPI000838E159|nr:AcfA family outer membrane beta-barrel protein [Thalassotalea crassostreae]